jgi:DNA-binding HxlR family transcriptional regulator
MPVPDKNIEKLYRLTYEGRELEAALQSLQEYPTFKEDCKAKKAIKERLRMDYMKLLLKKAA